MTGPDAATGASGPTPETVVAHELVGLRVRVVEAANGDLVGVAGQVVEETTNTLRIEGADGTVRTAPKAGATFEFELPAGGERTDGSRSTSGRRPDDEYVTVEGRRLVARPARRTQTATGGKTWHSA